MAVEYETLVQGGHSKFAEEIFKKIAPVEVESDEGNPITIVTDSVQLAKNTHLTFEPIQDLHGYDHPWAGGAGKNLLEVTVTNQTVNGVTFTVNDDGSVTANGTATANTAYSIRSRGAFLSVGTYILNGNADFTSNVRLQVYSYAQSANIAICMSNADANFSIQENEELAVFLYVFSGQSLTNFKCYPMIRLASESDASFEPYSNICPISGLDSVEVKRTGFNQWDEEWEVGYIYIVDGTKQSNNTNIRSKNYNKCVPNTAYYVTGASVRVCWYDADKNYIGYYGWTSTDPFISPSNAQYFMLYVNTDYGTTYNHDICINLSDPEKNGTYEPYQGQKVSVPFPTTVYGGTLDLETGELVVDMAIVDLGTLSWGDQGTVNTYQAIISDILTPSNNIVCSHYPTITASTSAANMPDKSIKTYGLSTSKFIIIKDSSYSAVSDFALAMSGVQLYYELATPITYTITPKQLSLLKGMNHISTNAKSVKVTFRNGKFATLDDIQAVNDGINALSSRVEIINSATGQTATFADGADGMNVKSLRVNMSPIQDLHGYDHPWPGGAGKNLLPINLAYVKEKNTVGVWNGNVYTINGCTAEFKTKDGIFVDEIVANGTATSEVTVWLVGYNWRYSESFKNLYQKNTAYTLTDDANVNACRIALTCYKSDNTNGFGYEWTSSSHSTTTIPDEDDLGYLCYLRINNGQTANNIVLKPMIRLASESDTTFEPYSNVCPIYGLGSVEVKRTGKNLAVTQRNNTVIGQAKSGTTYTVSYTPTSSNRGATIYKNNNSGATVATGAVPLTFTADEDFDIYFNGWTSNFTELQLEEGPAATNFEPYTEQILTESLPTTIYGGTLDLETGELMVDMGMVDLGTLNWTYDTSGNYFYARLTDLKFTVSLSTIIAAICSKYPNNGRKYSDLSDKEMTTNMQSFSSFAYVLVKDSTYTDAASFKSAMSGVQLCYELATPITYTLTPKQLETVKGINNISANGNTTIDVTYYADTKLYIDQKISTEIANALNS